MRSTWKDNELGYCLLAIQTRGNSSVPYDAVASYLRVQSASAMRDNEPGISTALLDAAERVESGDWDFAAAALREVN